MNKLYAGFENFITDGKLTEEEVIVIKWQYGYFGSFYKTIVTAFRSADCANYEKLRMAFPEIAGAMDHYNSSEGFFEAVELKAEKLHLNSQQ